MSRYRRRNFAARRERIQRLKRLIITIFSILLILVPVVCCIVLMCVINDMSQRIDDLSAQIQSLEQRGNRLEEAYKAQLEEATSSVVADEENETVKMEVENLVEDTRRKVYLTFDDGPSVHTDEILDILAQYDVKATFFVVGKENEVAKSLIKRIVEEGHSLGMHSYGHNYKELYASEESFRNDFMKQRVFLEELTGKTCNLYRFPGGSSNTVSNVDMHLLADYLDSQGVVFYDWNVTSGDGGSVVLDVDTLVENITTDVEIWNTAVVLLHDSQEKRTTVEALPQIIEAIQQMDDTVLLPITEDTVAIQHIDREGDNGGTN